MFEEGNIIYFDPFYFKNGNTAKSKYFVVLKLIGTETIIASLPTRNELIPLQNTQVSTGCIEFSESNLTCFLFSNTTEITECGKKFDFPTHLYAHQVDDYEIGLMNEIYPNEGSDYFIWGKIKSDLFQKILNCFKNSKNLKRKYKKIL